MISCAAGAVISDHVSDQCSFGLKHAMPRAMIFFLKRAAREERIFFFKCAVRETRDFFVKRAARELIFFKMSCARHHGSRVEYQYGSRATARVRVTRAYGSRAYVRGTPVRVTPVRVTVTQPLLLYRLIEYTVKSIIAQPEAERAGAQSRERRNPIYSATGARAPCCSTCTNPPRAPPPPRLRPLPSSR